MPSFPTFNPQAARSRFVGAIGGYPPALTIGLAVFLTFLYLLDLAFGIFEYIVLHTDSLFKLDMNRLSFYPMGHLSLLHLVFNLFGLLTPMSRFERSHGTVYTGVMLNLFAMVTGILYCVFGSLLISGHSVLGSSGWFFSFLACMAYDESRVKPTIQITPTYALPTLFAPFATLLFITIIVPGSSFFGHLFGLIAGYIYSFGYLNKLVPASWIIEWIEGKAEPAIQLIPSVFTYYREVDAKHLRQQDTYVSLFEPATVNAAAPVTGTAAAAAATTEGGFQGQGHTLV